MTTLNSTGLSDVPTPIVDRLREILRRRRMVLAVRGALGTLAVLVGALLLVMAVDSVMTITSAVSRWALMLSIVAATGAAAWSLLIHPLRHVPSITAVARAIEMKHPELEERLSSVVELLSSHDAPDRRGSQAMIAELANEAVHDVESVIPAREINFRAARPFIIAALAGVAVLGGLIALWPSETFVLLTRAILPASTVSNIQVKVIDPAGGSHAVLRGEPVRIIAEANKADAPEAELLIDVDGDVRELPMHAVGGGGSGVTRFAATLSAVARTFRYRVRCGEGATPMHTLRVVDRPAVRRIDLTHTYREYTGRRPMTVKDVPGDIKAVIGTTVEVALQVNRPASAELKINGETRSLPVSDYQPAGEGGTYTFSVEMKPGVEGAWSVQLTDEYGFASAPRGGRLIVEPDRAPQASIVRPEDEIISMRPTDQLPIDVEASDDFGIAEATLVLTPNTGELSNVPVALAPPSGQSAASGSVVLDLGSMDLSGVYHIKCQLRVRDNRPEDLGGANETLSNALKIKIDVRAEDYAIREIERQRKELEALLQAALKELRAAEHHASDARWRLGRQHGVLDDRTQKNLDAVRGELAKGGGHLREAARAALQSVFAEFSERIITINEQHVVRGARSTGQISLTDDGKERQELIDDAHWQVARAKEKVEAMLADLARLAEIAKEAARLRELAERQAELARQRKDMEATDDKEADEQWRKEQGEVADEIGEMMKEDSALAEALAAHVESMLEETKQLRQAQQRLAKQTDLQEKERQVDERILDLARRQAELANDVGQRESVKGHKQRLSEAASFIEKMRISDAIWRQEHVQKELRKKAHETDTQAATTALLEMAKDLARRQDEMAKQAAALEQRLQDAGKQADEAEKQVKQARQRLENAEKNNAAEQTAQAKRELAAAEKRLAEAKATPENVKAALKELIEPQQQIRYAMYALRKNGELHDSTRDAVKANPTAEMQQAERQMESGKEKQAANETAKAAAESRVIVTELEKALKKTKPAEVDAQADAKAVTVFAVRQEELTAETRKLLEEERELRKQQEEALRAEIARQQEELAKDAAELADAVREQAPQPNDKETEAAQAASESAEKARQGDMKAATEEASKAAEAMDDLAKQLTEQADQPPANPEQPSPKELGKQAEQLARRQSELADQMKALEQGRLAETASRQQEQLAGEAATLAEKAQDAAELAAEPEAKQSGKDAQKALQEAANAQQQAADELGENKPAEAGKPQEQAEQALGKAEQALSQMAAEMSEAAPQEEAVAQAEQSAQQAARTGQQESAQQAAEQLAKAAQQAAQVAQEMGVDPSRAMVATMPAARPSEAQEPAKGLQAMLEPGEVVEKLRKLGMSYADWARLPSELRNQVLQAAADDVPEEYRRLVVRYFREISRRSAAAENGGR